MRILKRVYTKFPLGLRLFLLHITNFKSPAELILIRKKLDVAAKFSNGIGFKDGKNIWHKAFKKFILSHINQSEIALEFFNNNIQLVKQSTINLVNDKVVLLCVVKNDFLKLKKMIEHHRKIGVTHFGILDNGSSDGSLDWMKEQGDIDLFTVEDNYTTNRREAWINRMIAHYGLERWYLIVDSDELFVYYKMEEFPLNSLIQYCENNHIKRIRGLMIDMYAQDSFYLSNNDEDYLNQCIHFDLDSYKDEKCDYLDLITGGPRERVFNQNPWLTKYPLCYFSKDDIQSRSHFLFPYKYNKNTKCLSALLHYKFLPRDIPKYKKISEGGNYFNGSIEYKNYLKVIDQNKLSFIYEGTEKYTGSESLYKISVLEKINYFDNR